MKAIYTVMRKVAPLEVVVRDALGRERNIHTNRNLNVGDTVLVVNGIVVDLVNKPNTQVFEV